MAGQPEGYNIPLHRSLTEPLLMAGVPRNFCMMNLTMGLGISIMIKFYFFLLITFFLHVVMVFVTKKDPQYFEALRRHVNDKDFFDA